MATHPTLSPEQAGIFDRIEAFGFDEHDTVLTFVSRLQRDNGWSRSYAVRAVSEYRKFVFLALVAGHPVSPSDQVDQVWHQHLLHTRSYWDRFCGQTLGRGLHHEPSRGGRQDRDKFRTWYEMTLKSYRKHLGEPPSDIWPDPAMRVGEAFLFERVDRKRYCVISRSWLKAAAMGAAALAWLVFLSG